MQGWKILKHSVRMVLDNLGAALKISAALYIVQAALSIYMSKYIAPLAELSNSNELSEAEMTELGLQLASYAPVVVPLAVFATFTGLWIAVAWHRFVLTGEQSGGIFPTLYMRNIWSYFGKGFKIMLVIFGIVLVISILATIGLMLLSAGTVLPILVPFIMFIVGFFAFYRLSPILPAAAIGNKMKLGDAWYATRSSMGAIAFIVVVFVIIGLISEILITPILAKSFILMMAWNVVVGWLMLMIGISILTTIYGHYIEGRELT